MTANKNRGVGVTQRFEFNDDKSRKFWQVAQTGGELHIAWGKIGTTGQSQVKAFDTEAQADAAKAKLIAEKTGKGDVAVGAATPAAATATATAPASALATPSPPKSAVKSATAAKCLNPAAADSGAAAASTDASSQGPATAPTQPVGTAATNTALPAEWAADALTMDAQAMPGVLRLVAHLHHVPGLLIAGLQHVQMDRTKANRVMQVPDEAVTAAMFAVSEFCREGWWSPETGDYSAPPGELEAVLRRLQAWQAQAATDDVQAQRLLGVNLHHQWQNLLAARPDAADPGPWVGAQQAVVPPLIVCATGPDGQWLRDVAELPVAVKTSRIDIEPSWFAVQLYANGADVATQCVAAYRRTLYSNSFYAGLHGLARMPHVDAFDALLAELNTQPAHLHDRIRVVLGLAMTRWPFLAVVGLTRTSAGARKSHSTDMAHLWHRLQLDATLARLEPVLPQLAQALAPWLDDAQRDWLAERCARWAEPADAAPAQALPAALAQPPWQAAASAPTSPAHVPCAATVPAVPPQMDWPQDERAQVLDGYYSPLPTGQASLDERLTALGFVQMHTQTEAKLRVEQALVTGDVAQLVTVWRAAMKLHRKDHGTYVRGFELFALPQAMALPFWNAVAAELDQPDESVWLSQQGLAALPGLVALAARRPADTLQIAQRFGSAELALPVVRAAFRSKKSAQAGRDWLLRWPEHAAAGLLPVALGKAGDLQQLALEALQFLAANGQGPLLHTVAQRVPDAQRAAVLARLDAIVQSDPLSRFPAIIGPLPAHWRPRAWRRPRLIESGQPLGNAALTTLGQMLSFPSTDGVYAGLVQVQRACSAQSLADFAWDGFLAWLAAGAPAANNWALSVLGLVGNDETARQLTPLIRAWPGESAHARAQMGLDVLEAIGSDTALMQLNGIAQKLKFKGLQDSAQLKILGIATRLGLSTAELEDRLAPELGLDAQGALVLDFGPRQFKVGFDEQLKPTLRDMTGARLKDLPKPNKADDAAMAAAATERYKALKKDAKTIAAQQLQRFEAAMCTERRWSEASFQTFIAQHPLVRHIAQRLVWGVFGAVALNESGNSDIPVHNTQADATDDGQGEAHDTDHRSATATSDSASDGGPLLGCFRLDEGASMRSADDEVFVMPALPHAPDAANAPDAPDAPDAPAAGALRIGVVHPLQLTAAQREAFAQSFTDYELMQPFEQLARSVHALAAPEGDPLALTRWQRRTLTSGRLMGLFARGWVRGPVQSGFITQAHKHLENGRAIALSFAPGLMVGDLDPSAPQTLGSLVWGDVAAQQRPWGELGAIACSEAIRDMRAVCEDN